MPNLLFVCIYIIPNLFSLLRFRYSPNFNFDTEVKQGYLDVVKRLFTTKEERIKIDKQLDMYSSSYGFFGDDMAIATRESKQPGNTLSFIMYFSLAYCIFFN